MGRGPRSFNFVTVMLLLGLVGVGYGLWKFFPVWWQAWQVDRTLADGAARAYRLRTVREPAFTQSKEALLTDLRQKVVKLGIADPEMTVNLDFIGDDHVEVRCEYRAYVVHPYVNRYSELKMHRSAQTSLKRPDWD
jgi:hypothetical protein